MCSVIEWIAYQCRICYNVINIELENAELAFEDYQLRCQLTYLT